MDDAPRPVLDAVVRLCRVVLALTIVATATGGLVAPVVTGHLSENGDLVALGLVEWSNLEFDLESTGPLVWRIVVESLFWLSLATAALAVIRWLEVAPRVASLLGRVITAAQLVCAVLVYPVSGQVADRAEEGWQFQWGWWVPILAGVLSALATWFDDQLRDADWSFRRHWRG